MTKLSIRKIKVRNRYRNSLGDIESLAANIKELGLLHPIVVRPDGRLIAGERRLTARLEVRAGDLACDLESTDGTAPAAQTLRESFPE